MKQFITILFLISNFSMMAQEARVETLKKTFSRTTTVVIDINASANTIWDLLTNSENFAIWNSTVTSLEGEIATGNKILLKTTLDPSRTFKLKVKEMVPNQKMVWGDAMGKRTYLLEEKGNHISFTMTEKIGGFMFPLFANKIPSFDESFETFAKDLKSAAEK